MEKEYSFENMRRKLHRHFPHKMAKKSRNGKIRITVSFLLVVFLLQIICPLTSFAEEPKTIRVGYFAFPGYHAVSQDENGPQGSRYGFDFLQNDDLVVLAQENGFTYQTVEYAEEMNLTEALRNGKVDGIVASSLRKYNGEKIVARFALEDWIDQSINCKRDIEYWRVVPVPGL